jgi:Sec-independent protein translocase protein TatA
MSFLEVLLIIGVALIVIKPERLPEICYFLGRTLAKLRGWYQIILGKGNIF